MKFKNKKGLLVRDVLLVGIAFCSIIAIYVLIFGSVTNNYNRQDLVDPEFSQNYDKLNDLADDVNFAQNSSLSNNGFSLVGSFDIALNSVFTVIKIAFNSLNIYGSMATDMTSDFTFLDKGVITVLMVSLLTMLTVALVFIWLSSVMRGRL